MSDLDPPGETPGPSGEGAGTPGWVPTGGPGPLPPPNTPGWGPGPNVATPPGWGPGPNVASPPGWGSGAAVPQPGWTTAGLPAPRPPRKPQRRRAWPFVLSAVVLAGIIAAATLYVSHSDDTGNVASKGPTAGDDAAAPPTPAAGPVLPVPGAAATKPVTAQADLFSTLPSVHVIAGISKTPEAHWSTVGDSPKTGDGLSSACAPGQPPATEGYRRVWSYTVPAGGLGLAFVDLYRYKTPEEAKAQLVARRTPEGVHCLQDSQRQQVEQETQGTAEVADQYYGTPDAEFTGTSMRASYQIPYTAFGQDCTEYKDAYYAVVGTDLIVADFGTCRVPFDQAQEQAVFQKIVALHGG